MPKNLFGSGSPGQSQRQGQEQKQVYENIREQPGTGGRLFWGELIDKQVIDEQGIKGGKTTHLLVPDGKGGYRRPTAEEMDAILENLEKEQEK